MQYDAANEMTADSYPQSSYEQHVFSYDMGGRATAAYYPEAGTVTYNYDNALVNPQLERLDCNLRMTA
jgi:hypothetical protein